MSTSTAGRRVGAAAIAAATALALSACSGNTAQPPSGGQQSATTAAPAPAASTTAASAPTVPGYKPGEIPPIPLFSVPPIGVFARNADKAVIDTATTIASVPGITVAPAACDGSGMITNGGNTILGGNGSAISNNGSGSQAVNNGDGSGIVNEGPVSIVYGGDGSGTYTNSDTGETITVQGDGSGTYSSTSLQVVVNIDMSGTYTNSATGESVIVGSNGDGSYANSITGVSYNNDGKGAGTYSDPSGLTINNFGNGNAQVVSPAGTTTVPADPLPPVGKVGPFPSVGSLKPVESCGTTITLQDGVLFDFGESTVRADAAGTLAKLASVLADAKVPAAHVYGHTDSISDEAFNQTLSEQRAKAVVDELKKNGATATLDWQGFGETKPVAPNTNDDGSDNPAGRQANRRVEIYIPTF